MKTFLVTWPGTSQTVSEDQLETVCGLLTSSGLSHDVVELDAEKPAAQPAAKPAKKTK